MNLGKLCGIAIVLGMSLGSALARADFLLVVDLDTSTAGIQSTRDVNVGESFTAQLFLQMTNGESVTSILMGMDFDAAQLSLSGVDVSGRPAGFGNVNPVVVDNTLGSVRPFDALTFTPVSGPSVLLGTFTVTAKAAIPNVAANITPAFQVLGIDGLTDGNFLVVPNGLVAGDGGVFFNSALVNVSAVPEPASLLAGLALCLPVFGRRCLSRKSALRRV